MNLLVNKHFVNWSVQWHFNWTTRHKHGTNSCPAERIHTR